MLKPLSSDESVIFSSSFLPWVWVGVGGGGERERLDFVIISCIAQTKIASAHDFQSFKHSAVFRVYVLSVHVKMLHVYYKLDQYYVQH